MKVQAHSSLTPLLECNQDQTRTFLTTLRVMETLSSFRLILEGKSGNEIPESLRLEFLEKLLANDFALSDTEDNTCNLLNRGSIADLPLLTLHMPIPNKEKIKVNFYFRTFLFST